MKDTKRKKESTTEENLSNVDNKCVVKLVGTTLNEFGAKFETYGVHKIKGDSLPGITNEATQYDRKEN